MSAEASHRRRVFRSVGKTPAGRPALGCEIPPIATVLAGRNAPPSTLYSTMSSVVPFPAGSRAASGSKTTTSIGIRPRNGCEGNPSTSSRAVGRRSFSTRIAARVTAESL